MIRNESKHYRKSLKEIEGYISELEKYIEYAKGEIRTYKKLYKEMGHYWFIDNQCDLEMKELKKEIEEAAKEKTTFMIMKWSLNEYNIGMCNECPHKEKNICEKKCFIYSFINEYEEV